MQYTEPGVSNACRQPGILDIFAQVWGTSDLIASFDGMNVTMPINAESGRVDVKPTEAWPRKPNPHPWASSDITIDMDQNPRRIDQLELYQGIANLAPNGPADGGLCVLRGSHKLHGECFDAIGGFRPEGRGRET